MFTIGPPMWGSGASAPAAALLNHFDGANNSNVFVDAIPGQTWVIGGGSPTIRTTQSKFGGSSLFCPDGSWIDCTSLSGKLPSGDYSIDFWVLASAACEFAISINGGGFNVSLGVGMWSPTTISHIRLGNSYDMRLNIGDGAGSVLNRWVHVFAGRSGGTDYAACNGVMTSSNNANTVSGAVTNIQIGMYNYSTSGAYFDELRVLIGSCAHTASFTPPTAPYA